jgi:hypothetical protein
MEREEIELIDQRREMLKSDSRGRELSFREKLPSIELARVSKKKKIHLLPQFLPRFYKSVVKITTLLSKRGNKNFLPRFFYKAWLNYHAFI